MPDPTSSSPYVFVSYASVDRARVLPIAAALRERGLDVWMDVADITGGTSYGSEIVDGIKGCAAVTLMCSVASLASRNVKQEIQLAWRYQRPILPLLLEPLNFPDDVAYWLEGAQWIEVLERPADDWMPVVLRALAKTGNLPALAPPPQAAPDEEPAVPLIAVPSNLPALGADFFGRERELSDLRALLTNGRLVTLTGPGGTGKTRLALEVARSLAGAYLDGVWFVDLAALTDPALVPAAVASAIGVAEKPGVPIEATLREALAGRTTLIVVDNVEQVSGCSTFIGDLVAACPGLSVVATSRVPLRAAGEWVYPVAPLAVPDSTDLPPLPTLGQNPAVRLFVERARQARPDFRLSDGNAPAIIEICRRLDGLPLAIELAAARVRLLPPPALAGRLGSRLALLTRGAGAHPRQQTLRATIGWSYDLLDPAEQALFRRLAVFAGGCAIEAAEAVTPDEALPPERVLDGLDALIEHSLVRPGPGADNERPRIGMLETIREFALDELVASGEAERFRSAHAAYFLQVAETTEPRLTGPHQALELDRLETDHDNLRVALSWFEERAEREAALRLAGALWRFWWIRGHAREGLGRFEGLLRDADNVPPAVRAKALDGAGALAEAQGQLDRALALHEQALAISRMANDPGGTARALTNLGFVAYRQGDFARAAALHEEGLSILRELGDERAVASTLHELSRIAQAEGNLERAEELSREMLEIGRAAGDSRIQAIGLHDLGTIAFLREEYTRTADLYEASLPFWRLLGDRDSVASTLANLGRAFQLLGNLERARDLFGQAIEEFRALGDRGGEAFALWAIAYVTRQQGDEQAALPLLRDSLTLYRQVGEKFGIAECIESLAGVAIALGKAVEGSTLLGACEALREAIGSPLPASHRADYDRDVATAKAQLDPDTFASAWAIGRVMSLDQALTEALSLAE